MKSVLVCFALLFCTTAITANEISVTVYNSNLGVISETRTFSLNKGINRLNFTDVPSLIDPASVTVELLNGKGGITILEQNYAYDLVSPDQIYRRYVDKEIELLDKEGKLITGKLLAYNNGAITLKDKNNRIKIVGTTNITEVNFPSLPDGLITRPTLFWLYNSTVSGDLTAQVGYQTSGLNWSAEYVGVLDDSETNLNLTGWASINNNSGKSYNNARLKLVAGDINRVNREYDQPRRMEMTLSKATPSAGFREKEFFEYHLYTLPRKATVANHEKKQISLFEPATTSVDKQFIYRPDRDPKKVEVSLKLTNSSSSGLGIPLPAGRVRLFKADSDGGLILLGEDRIDHTPKDEEIDIKVGFAFDISAEEKLIKQDRISERVEQRQFQIDIRNHKRSDITVRVEKSLYGDWELLESTLSGNRKDGNTLVFDVSVKAGESTTLTYLVRFTHR